MLAWRHLWSGRARALATILGVALGVAVFTAVRLASESTLESFRRSLDVVAGRATLQVSAGEPGFDERLYLKVKGASGVRQAAPVIQAVAPMAGGQGEAVLVLGVDLLAEEAFRDHRLAGLPAGEDPLQVIIRPDTIFVTRGFAEEHGLGVGSDLVLSVGPEARRFVIRGLLEPAGAARAFEGNVVLMDIATAQEAFGKVGRLDRIDLISEPATDLRALRARLAALLPPNVEVERPDRRNAQVDKMLRAFRLNLTALSAIALVVSLFLIYNAVSLSVVRRRREIGILRSLGVTRREVWALFAAEAVAAGLLGSLAGLGLGIVLAKGALQAVAGTVSELYAYLKVTSLALDPLTLVTSLALGMVTALAAALFPAWRASTIHPRQAMEVGGYERRAGSSYWRLAALGGLLLVGAYAASLQPPVADLPLYGYLAVLLLIGGVSLLVPLAAVSLTWLARPLLTRWLRAEGLLAVSNLRNHLGRNAVAVGAMMTALAMLVGLAVMVTSFRSTVELWVEETMRADLIVSPAARFTRGAAARLPAVEPFRVVRLSYRGDPIVLGSGDFTVVARFGILLFKGADGPTILAETKRREGVVVSESFALRYGVGPGSRLELPTPAGTVTFPVLGVFYDYTTEGGKVVMDRALYLRYWQDRDVTALVVYLRPGVDARAARARILAATGGGQELMIITNRDLKARVLQIFDNTFAITYALELIAMLVAALAVFHTLWASVLERRREIGILRAVGTSRPQVLRMVVNEAGLLGLLAGAIGVVAGLCLSLILIYVINKQSFGWTIQFRFPPSVLVEAAALMLLTSLVAGLLPARRAASMNLAEVLQYEG
ncbi:MAG: FtsX-like permease family protein [Deltaproteobacteria bacterium]|nr:FtsX-like permease family protein [Deltaproteobacteria bacterium]